MKKIIYTLSTLSIMVFLMQGCKQPSNSQETKLTVTPSELNMKVGDTATLKASLEGVKFSSGNDKVATVTEEGVVSAIKAGKTVITCVLETKDKDGNDVQKTAFCTCKVSSLTLTPTSSLIEKGSTGNVIAKVEKPDSQESATVSFSSENTNIATVDNKGVITGVEIGKTVITAECDGMKATCNVEVVAPVTFDVVMDKICVVDATFTITPSSNDATYAVGCLTKEKYDIQKNGKGLFDYDRRWYEFVAERARAAGDKDATWQKIAEEQGYYKEGAYTTSILGVEYISMEDLKPKTPCVIYWYRIDRGGDKPSSECFSKEFTTQAEKPSENNITITIEEAYSNGIKANVQTTNNDKYFVGFAHVNTVNAYLDGGSAYAKGYTLKDMARKLVADAMSNAAQENTTLALHSGNKTITPNDIQAPQSNQKEFYLVYFACDLENGIGNDIKYEKFKLTNKVFK